MRFASHHRKGTMLIELVVCTFLVGITAVALFSALLVGAKFNERARHYTRANEIAAQAIEVVRGTPFASLTTPYSGAFLGNVDPVTELPSGTGSLVISYNNSPTNTVKKAIVTVNWVEKGQPVNIVYATLISQ